VKIIWKNEKNLIKNKDLREIVVVACNIDISLHVAIPHPLLNLKLTPSMIYSLNDIS
jgi:hypothetical protein